MTQSRNVRNTQELRTEEVCKELGCSFRTATYWRRRLGFHAPGSGYSVLWTRKEVSLLRDILRELDRHNMAMDRLLVRAPGLRPAAEVTYASNGTRKVAEDA
jgi:hypothetical protein